MLQASPRIVAFIKGFETCWKPVPGRPGFFMAYKPTPVDHWTIGWGSTGRDIAEGLVWSQEQCDLRFNGVLAETVAGVNKLLSGAATTQDQFDALVSFAYNVGLDDDADTKAEGLGDSSLLRLHKAGDYAGAAAEFIKWDHQDGKMLVGLERRRLAETAIYRGNA